MKILEQEGVEPERIRLAQAGPYEPQTLHVDDRSQALNSRVEVYVLGELAQESGGNEGRARRAVQDSLRPIRATLFPNAGEATRYSSKRLADFCSSLRSSSANDATPSSGSGIASSAIRVARNRFWPTEL